MAKQSSRRLIRAVRTGDVDEVREMILVGADVGTADANGYSPLHWCSQTGDCIIADELLRAGAKCDLPDVEGFTPIRIALAHGHVDLAFVLLNSGADLWQSVDGSTLLHISSASGSTRFVEWMLANLIDCRIIDQQDEQGDGRSALHWAMQESQHEIARMLIAAGANVNLADSEGFTPLHTAVGEGDSGGVILLIDAGAEVNPPLSSSSPLELAVAYEQNDIVKRLIAAGADVNSANADGVRPLQVAIESRNQEILDILRGAGAV